jgi:hypothetical protein
VDYEGDGVVDVTTVNIDEIFQITYNTPGIYNASMTITTTSNVYKGSSVLLVQNLESMEVMFKSIWNGMNDALVSGNLNVALNYLDDYGKEKYGTAFEALAPYMGDIISSYSVIQTSEIKSGYAEFGVNRMIRNINYLYLIYFMKDINGNWKLHSM